MINGRINPSLQFFHEVAEYDQWMPAELSTVTSKVAVREDMPADREEATKLLLELKVGGITGARGTGESEVGDRGVRAGGQGSQRWGTGESWLGGRGVMAGGQGSQGWGSGESGLGDREDMPADREEATKLLLELKVGGITGARGAGQSGVGAGQSGVGAGESGVGDRGVRAGGQGSQGWGQGSQGWGQGSQEWGTGESGLGDRGVRSGGQGSQGWGTGKTCRPTARRPPSCCWNSR